MTNNPDQRFWQEKRVLITGHTGFKGAWLSLWLDRLGAKVRGLSLAPDTQPSLFGAADIRADVAHTICDLRDPKATALAVSAFKPEIVFHLAAQALVRPSYNDPLVTFETNVMGTANLLDAVRRTRTVKACVVATTDKVYRNEETGRAFEETDPLGGHDPYSASKAASEIVIESYRKSYLSEAGVGLAAARAGNVIGGGDWSEDRLIPDAVRAWTTGTTLKVRRPNSVRPWQHVLEPLLGYIKLAESIWDAPSEIEAVNFGPDQDDTLSVRKLIECAQPEFGRGETKFSESLQGPHEAGLLSLNNERAREVLDITPRWRTEVAVAKTMNWYKRFYDGEGARELCLADIDHYEGSNAV